MAIISRLAVVLGMDAGEFNAQLGLAKDKVLGFAQSSQTTLLAVGTAFAGVTMSAARFADQIADVAKANEMSVSAVLRMSQALQVNGGQAENAGKLMASFNNKIDEAAQGSDKAQKAFARIGVSIKDLKTLSPEQLFEKTVQSLANIQDATTRNALAMDMFGKAIKGVDIRGLAQEMDSSRGSFKDTEEAFLRINAAIDKLDRFWTKFKTDLAVSTSDTISDIGDWAEKFGNWVDKVRAKNLALRKEFGDNAAIYALFGKNYGLTSIERSYGSVQGANVPSIMTGIGGTADPGGIKRQVNLAESIDKANKALEQQIKTYDLEAKTVGQVQSAAEKLKIEYAEGGKYFAASEALKTKAMNAAIAADKARQAYELQKMMESSKYEERKLIIQQQYAFATEAERQYQLDILDLEKRINDQKEKGLLLDKEAEALYREQEMDRINRKKNIEDEQHTFEYGWRKAFEEYKRDANDAAKNAGELFSTMAKGMEDMLTEFIRKGKLDFKSFANLVLDEIARIEARIIASKIMEMMGMGASGGLLGGIWKIFSGGSYPTSGSAYTHSIFSAGGNELGSMQPSVVGENGPELFIPRSAGTVVPNNRMGSLLGGGPSIVYNGPYIENMSAIDTQSATQFLAKNKQAVWSANQSAQRSLPQSR